MRNGEGKSIGPGGRSRHRLGGLAIAVGLAALTATAPQARRLHSRAYLVPALVEEQFTLVISATPSGNARGPFVGSEPLALQRGLLRASLPPGDPESAAAWLHTIRQGARLPVTWSEAVSRWNETLTRWSTHERELLTYSPAAARAALLNQVRRRHPEATGYRRAGHASDATAHYLWVVSLLTRFVMSSPLDPAVPEALFLLGDAYLRLRPVVPTPLRMERVLGTLWEEYPDSIWAARARRLWLEETGVPVG